MSQTDSIARPPDVTIPPAIINHIVKAAIAALIAGWLLWLSYAVMFVDERDPDPGLQYGVAAVSLVIAIVAGLACSRNVHALFVRPVFILTPEGFRLDNWCGVGFRGIFLPYYRRRQHVIRWEDFVQSLHYSHRINYVTVAEELRLTTRAHGAIAFGRDVFKPSVRKIQRTLLDYIDELVRAPLRAAGRLVEFQRRRWSEPVVLRGAGVPLWLVGGSWALTLGLGVACFTDLPSDWIGPAIVISAVVAIMITWWWREAARCRHVALSADGLSVGRDETKCRLITWNDIRFVRPHMRDNSSSGKGAFIQEVEVRLDNGETVMIQGWEQADFSLLMAYLEPPLDLLPEAWSLIAQGHSAEAAARAVGMPPRN